VGIYASPDNWRTCYPHMPIGMLGIYHLLFVYRIYGNGYLGRGLT